jgi:hypothetical protein
MNSKPRVLINFSDYRDDALENKAESILQMMTGNVNFSDPIPPLTVVQAALTAYSEALVNAASKDIAKVAAKNAYRKNLELQLNQLGMFVNYAANGDAAKLATSGFTMAKTPASNQLESPGNVTLSNGVNTGELQSKVPVPKGAKSYLHQITADPLTENSTWESMASSRCTNTFTNLQPGKKYWVRVAAIGTKEQVAYSNVASQYVQ